MKRLRSVVSILLYVLTITRVTYAQTEGLFFYENLDLLPCIDLSARVHYESSFDRTGGNDDGFKGTYSALSVDENGEYIIFDQPGPGCVYSFYFTGITDARLKFYFDGEKIPRLDRRIEEYFDGSKKPFTYPFVYNKYQSTGSNASALPIEFEKHLKVTTDKRIGFYNIYAQIYKNIRLKSFEPENNFENLNYLFRQCGSEFNRTKSDSVIKKVIDLDGRKINDAIELFSYRGEGTILFIKFNPLFETSQYELNNLYIRIYYDDYEKPSVDAPAGFFFGSGLGEATVRSLFIGMSPSDHYYFVPE